MNQAENQPMEVEIQPEVIQPEKAFDKKKFYLACKEGSVKEVEKLFSSMPYPCPEIMSGGAVLSAVHGGNLEVLKYLKNTGINIEYDNHYIIGAAIIEDQLHLIKYFEEIKFPILESRWISMAMTHGRLKILEYLDKQGGDITEDLESRVSDVIWAGNVKILKYLVRRGVLSLADGIGEQHMDTACEEGKLEIIKYFGKLNSNLYKIPGLIAVSLEYPAITRHLVKKGAIPDVRSLVIAVDIGDVALVQYLVEHGAQLTPESSKNLIRIAAKNNEIDIVEYLLDLGAVLGESDTEVDDSDASGSDSDDYHERRENLSKLRRKYAVFNYIQKLKCLQDEKETDPGKSPCSVCMENKAVIVFNCGHRITCVSCSLKILKSEKRACPACRTKIRMATKVWGQ